MKANRTRIPNIIYYPLLTIVLAALLVVLSLTVGRDIGKRMLSQWQVMVIRGAPSYDYEHRAELTRDSAEVKHPVKGEQLGQLSCETVGLKAPIYYGDTDQLLEMGAGLYTGAYLPGEGKTIVIGAHDTTFFAPLEDIKPGDLIAVSTLYGDYHYEVERIQTGSMMDQSLYPIQNEEEELILYTCYPFGATGQIREERYFVYAKRTEQP